MIRNNKQILIESLTYLYNQVLQQYKQKNIKHKHTKKNIIKMGNKLKNATLFKTANSQIGTVSICPNCQQQFPPTITYENFDQHVTHCLQSFRPTDQERLKMKRRKKSKDGIGQGSQEEAVAVDIITVEVYVKKVNFQSKIEKDKISQQFNRNKQKLSSKDNINQKQKILYKIDPNSTKPNYRWIKSQLTYSQSLLNEMSLAQIRKQATAYKILWLHQRLANRRITWKQGSEQITFHPEEIVKDSLQLIKINQYKQLKVVVMNDVVHDAGGLLRQWANMLLKALISQFQLFVRNSEGYYVLNGKFDSFNKLEQHVEWNRTKRAQKDIKKSAQIKKQEIKSEEQPTIKKKGSEKLQQKEKIQQRQQLQYDFYEEEELEQDYEQNLQQLYKFYTQNINNRTNFNTSPSFNNIYSNNKQAKKISLQSITYANLYELFACLLAKIVIEKVTVPVHFDWIFLNSLLNFSNKQKYHYSNGINTEMLQRLQTFDKDIYNSIVYLYNLYVEQVSTKNNSEKQLNPQIKQLCLTFSVLTSESQHEMIPNGKKIPIETPAQLLQYIQKFIQFYQQKVHRNQINIIKEKFYTVIKQAQFDGLLGCDQFEVLVNGVQGDFIDVKDWEDGTQYKQPYTKDHKVIRFFWNTVKKMTSNQKTRLLKFVTGSERLPLYGFKNLQTNRGQTSKFIIQSVKYDKKHSCYPKAHTCFNRLVLPSYPNEQTLAQNLIGVLNAEFDGVWGME